MHAHPMRRSPKAESRNGDIHPPHDPQEVKKSFSTNPIVPVNNIDGNNYKCCRAYGIAAKEETITRVSKKAKEGSGVHC